jgi:Copper type II ascorbate-dependent monooxygenase, C-terminal domain
MRPVVLCLVAPLLVACSGSGETSGRGGGPSSCPAGEELFRGACVDPARRYEPLIRLDTNNVVAFGGPLQTLDLPDPPKSGFRIVAPPRTLAPGEEEEYCISWPFPVVHDKFVYAGRLYTTPGLHHSNLISKPIDPKYGKNPYPACHPGASDPFADIGDGIPDVLFANTTQIVGTETLAFPPGIAFPIDTRREIATDIHLLNTSSESVRVEVAYDFFTMPKEELVHEVAPFTLEIDAFDIPPHATQTIGSTCGEWGGEIVELMPHTHKYRTKFEADLLDANGAAKNVIDDGALDTKSEIQVFATPLSLDERPKIRFECTFANTTTHDIHYGIGQNEMCILFGYLYPIEKQFVAHAATPDAACQSTELGIFRGH